VENEKQTKSFKSPMSKREVSYIIYFSIGFIKASLTEVDQFDRYKKQSNSNFNFV
tara:strand:- start:404 stop:568 length:165 start_codon:yes stop_codon:yes gene_type:complete